MCRKFRRLSRISLDGSRQVTTFSQEKSKRQTCTTFTQLILRPWYLERVGRLPLITGAGRNTWAANEHTPALIKGASPTADVTQTGEISIVIDRDFGSNLVSSSRLSSRPRSRQMPSRLLVCILSYPLRGTARTRDRSYMQALMSS